MIDTRMDALEWLRKQLETGRERLAARDDVRRRVSGTIPGTDEPPQRVSDPPLEHEGGIG